MSFMRKGLLALGEPELIALANRGLLKRARKMMTKNEHQLSVSEDGAVTLNLGEVKTVLEVEQSLTDASCNCGASGLCRHKILAILAYQQSTSAASTPDEQTEWCPGDFEDSALQELMGHSTWKRALRLKTGGARVKLERGEKPVAYLPTCSVSFLVPNELSYARCDCSLEGACEHIALAVWAFGRGGDSVSFDVQEEKLDLDFGSTDRIFDELLHLGVSAVETAKIKLLREQEVDYRKRKLIWLSDLCSDLAETLENYLSRGASFDSSEYSALLVEWWARTLAVHKGSSSVLLGKGESFETNLEQTSLTCLGLRIGQDENHTSADLFFGEPTTGVVTVLSRSWKGEFTGAELAKKRVTPGDNLLRLATSQMITESAKRRANRTLLIGKSRVGKTSIFEDTGNWEERFSEPLLVKDFQALSSELKAAPPAIFSARLRAENLRILSVKKIEDLVYAPGSQTLFGKLFDGQGHTVNLVFPYRKSEPGALSCLVESLTNGTHLLSGFVHRRSGVTEFTPLSLVASNKVWCPALAEPKDFSEVPYIASASQMNYINEAWELCVRAPYQGFKFLTPQWQTECRKQADILRQHGFKLLADKMSILAREPNRQNWFAAALRAFLLVEN